MKKTEIMLMPIMVLLFFAAVTPALASPQTTTRGTTNGMDYTQTIGSLGKADYVVRIPDNWNGMLFVGCHAYSLSRSPNMQYQFDSLGNFLVSNGFAYASSEYGSEGYCVQNGIIRTHQLTEYVINNYGITGKVFLFGGSMGGEIALLLGEKYPYTYSGVLDICGPKDLITMYENGAVIARSTLQEVRAILGWPSTVSDAAVQAFKDFAVQSGVDLIEETGGTPDAKLNAYEQISPVYHTDIHIPVISLVGTADYTVPLSQTYEYQTAIIEAGHASLYRMDIVNGGGHINAKTLAQAPAAALELVAWSNSLD